MWSVLEWCQYIREEKFKCAGLVQGRAGINYLETSMLVIDFPG